MVDPFRTPRSSKFSGDRFIPNRSAVSKDFAHYRLSGGNTIAEEINSHTFMSRIMYLDRISGALSLNQDRILAFNNHSMVVDYSVAYTNGIRNGIPRGPVRSVRWSLDGTCLAIGLSGGVQFWDLVRFKLIRSLMSHEILRVDSLDWKNAKILTCGTSEGSIVDIDVRVKSPILLGRYEVHRGGVCKLKWCDNEKQLASGGIDKVVHIWDCSKSSSWLHKFDEHKAAVRAICWCPSEHNVLASGGGVDDHCIKFWDTQKGERLDSVDTGSEVCELIWSKHEHEVLSSHGSKSNHMTLWKYPFMLKLTELRAHSSRVLYMSQSPDGYSVASAAPHDSVSIWKNLFGTPGSHKVSPRKRKPGTFSDFPLIRSLSADIYYKYLEFKSFNISENEDGYSVASAAPHNSISMWKNLFGHS
ncbi:hypothetical protein Patl1_11312 [Pistacia atlantica]|uniref:Uncharacterized protein n=1 Tax=Pistacia atlantica TaxID=434234 RepID=A0ACC0ZZH2_9ROSI|nr:hypothetical protein Patl1_11312 [Pistacia atlantica]